MKTLLTYLGSFLKLTVRSIFYPFKGMKLEEVAGMLVVVMIIGGVIVLGIKLEEKVDALATYETKEVALETNRLVALDTNEDINGSYSTTFFVGRGYIREDLYYHFFHETVNGIKYEKVRAENSYPGTYIIETDEEPRYVKYGLFYANPEDKYYNPEMIRRTRNVLYIPKGSIITNYRVNGE